MTDTQLVLALVVPFVFAIVIMLFVHHALRIRSPRMPERVAASHQRLDDLRELWRAELRRVEDVHGIRLKHLEDRKYH